MSSVQPAADGVGVTYIEEGTPAEEIGLSRGIVLTYFNDTRVTSFEEYSLALFKTKSGQTVNVTYVQGKNEFTKSVVLADMANYTKNQSYAGRGYLGTWFSTFGYEDYLSILKNPFSQFPDGFLTFYIIPFIGYLQGYNPIVSPFTDSYIITGPLGVIPSDLFWIIVNALYWIFWLNLAVALFNVLPMIPLDGGYLFNDAISSLIKRAKKDISDEKREKAVKNISLIISLSILFFIMFPYIIKYF